MNSEGQLPAIKGRPRRRSQIWQQSAGQAAGSSSCAFPTTLLVITASHLT